jgi:transposase InsO family protein
MDLIDFRRSPDENFKYILHIKDHFTRFSWAYPFVSKKTNDIALKLFELFTEIRPPTILQSGREFTSKIIKNLSNLWNNLKIINRRPRHPQSQGLIERGNSEIGKLIGK